MGLSIKIYLPQEKYCLVYFDLASKYPPANALMHTPPGKKLLIWKYSGDSTGQRNYAVNLNRRKTDPIIPWGTHKVLNIPHGLVRDPIAIQSGTNFAISSTCREAAKFVQKTRYLQGFGMFLQNWCPTGSWLDPDWIPTGSRSRTYFPFPGPTFAPIFPCCAPAVHQYPPPSCTKTAKAVSLIMLNMWFYMWFGNVEYVVLHVVLHVVW